MKKLMAALVVALTAMLFAGVALAATLSDVTCPSGGINVTPSQDLAAVAAGNSGSKTYCLAPGTYTVARNIKVEGADKFLGLSTDRSQVKVKSNGTQSYGAKGAIVTGSTVDHVFDTGGSNGATFENLDISGAVHANSCEPNCGRGIGSGGTNITVKNVRAHHNENDGIGAPGTNLKVYDSEFDHNGNVDSARDGGKVSAAGIKGSDPGGSSNYSLSVFNSNIHDNYWTGVWCDIGCEQFEVHDSNVSNNGKSGIHDEISYGPAVFEGNTIQNNGKLTSANQHTGLLIVSSRNAEAFGNAFGGNVSEGVKIMEDARDPVLGNISVHDNQMNGDKLAGCGLSTVTCTNNG